MQFPSPETSGSYLYLRAWYCKKPLKLNWYNQIWRDNDWPNEEFADLKNLPVAIVRKCVSLTQMGDKAAVYNAVAEFKGLLKKHLGLSFSK